MYGVGFGDERRRQYSALWSRACVRSIDNLWRYTQMHVRIVGVMGARSVK